MGFCNTSNTESVGGGLVRALLFEAVVEVGTPLGAGVFVVELHKLFHRINLVDERLDEQPGHKVP